MKDSKWKCSPLRGCPCWLVVPQLTLEDFFPMVDRHPTVEMSLISAGRAVLAYNKGANHLTKWHGWRLHRTNRAIAHAALGQGMG